MKQTPEPATHKPGEHLQYLLTAYLFDNISTAGRREVEMHLETCAQCREALENLRGTLGDLEDALDNGGHEYVFEERRRTRVIEAARERKSFITKLSFNWKYGAVAALLMVCALGILLPALGTVRKRARETAAPSVMYTELAALDSAADGHSTYGFKSESKAGAAPAKSAPAQFFNDNYESASKSEPSETPAPAADGRRYRDVRVSGKIESTKNTNEEWRESANGQVVQGYIQPVPESKSEPGKPRVPAAENATPNYRYPVPATKPAPAKPEVPAALPPPPPTLIDPTSRERSDVVVPPDALNKAALGDEFETINPDRPDTQSAFGNPDAKMFHSVKGDNDAAGGGGVGGVGLDDLIGVGGGASPGTGGGWGGGKGEGDRSEGSFGRPRGRVRDKVLLAVPAAPAPAEPAPPVTAFGIQASGALEVQKKEKPADKWQNMNVQEKSKDIEILVKAQKREVDLAREQVAQQMQESKALGATTPGRRPAVETEMTNRKGVAVAAKDAEIRSQEELITQERAEKEKYAEMNKALAEQNRELSELNGKAAKVQNNFNQTLEEAQKNLEQSAVLPEKVESASALVRNDEYKRDFTLNRERAERRNMPHSENSVTPDNWQTLEADSNKPVDLSGLRRDHERTLDNVADVTREVRRYSEELSKAKEAVINQQQAVVVERDQAARARNEKSAMENELNVAKVKDLEKKISDLKSAQQDGREQLGFLDSFKGDIKFNGSNVNTAGIDNRKKNVVNVPAPITIGGLLNLDGSTSKTVEGGGNVGGFYYIAGGKTSEDIKVAATEQSVRGFQHFSEENSALTLQDFARRPLPVPPPLLTDEGLDEDEFIQRHGTRPFVDAQRDKLSTFAMDVDTSSYTRTRATLIAGQLPDPETVRVEEFVNYFKQPYSVAGDEAFGVFAEGGPSLFGAGNDLEMIKVGIKSRDPRPDERKPAVLTFVIDSSGSMGKGDRLELVQHALKSLVNSLRPEDAVCIVAFGEHGELVLPRTLARQKQHILDAIETLAPRGGTNVESGLSLGYRMADEAFSAEAVNRIILCSDGVANVGAKGPDEILKLVKVFAGRGIDLCTVGFGMGQYNDKMMQRLANEGNGSSYFVDNKTEAARVFSEQLPPNLDVLARDAKVQVEFNPEVIERYRLLGYEKRKIADKDFRNDKIDAGEVGHSTLVTALYEIKRKTGSHGALGKVFLRWKDAGYRHLPVIERNYPLPEGILASSASQTNPNLRFLACVAEFAELLRGSRWARDGSYAAVLHQLRQLPPSIQSKAEFTEVVNLVTQAQRLSMQKWIREAGAR